MFTVPDKNVFLLQVLHLDNAIHESRHFNQNYIEKNMSFKSKGFFSIT